MKSGRDVRFFFLNTERNAYCTLSYCSQVRLRKPHRERGIEKETEIFSFCFSFSFFFWSLLCSRERYNSIIQTLRKAMKGFGTDEKKIIDVSDKVGVVTLLFPFPSFHPFL